ncbi:hypothetical protein RIF29_28184 [Crotalaria pallida]|uniref:Uncharacterized protein n=1 Tax=Crotalaria pallida TaxID=3830 RepID=A0AAN9ER69_CROPI
MPLCTSCVDFWLSLCSRFKALSRNYHVINFCALVSFFCIAWSIVHSCSYSLSLPHILTLPHRHQGRLESSPSLHHDPISHPPKTWTASSWSNAASSRWLALQESLAAYPSSSILPNLQQQQPLPDDAVLNPTALHLR